jgi:hypothetical protein
LIEIIGGGGREKKWLVEMTSRSLFVSPRGSLTMHLCSQVSPELGGCFDGWIGVHSFEEEPFKLSLGACGISRFDEVIDSATGTLILF